MMAEASVDVAVTHEALNHCLCVLAGTRGSRVPVQVSGGHGDVSNQHREGNAQPNID